ncbi:HTH-type transcriptional regulator AscG [Enterobacter cancerogenus]|uniref:HTH-type transcriptional regulator AscG n=1 Tax=Enterobacter cancerogenus TaxID=69218 RepID=A0A484YIV4_9ENTR|nr:HTH-type transcriptional regulator AscG [Enterobacter cancerogenus]
MATMLDVSLRAGVSKATVSRVLNGTGQVKESTRQQVFTAMEELGYRPNFLARSLANQTSNSIGLVVSTFDGFLLWSPAAAGFPADRNARQATDRHRRS